ncbi:uncharacterized protein LOC128390840 [Panonychus citri]|uniref:uncharacterized protein LOC128390840 n=1 Tax=Panonychus citri TaxID=50023 RepID=UPI0023081E10|nr:uncharacterized protein LOC128390840 [Panonychus citri]
MGIRKVDPTVKSKDVKKWLKKQETYSLFKQNKNRFPRLPILVDKIDEQWQIDLMDMSWVSQYNDGYRYLLNVIDCFSRFAWSQPIKKKTGPEVVQAVENILINNRVPEKLQSDQGKEFKNSAFKALMKRKKINHFYATDGKIKCAIVERFNGTLRARIYRYLHHVNSGKFINVLDEIVESYNNSFHRTIGMAPAEVGPENSSLVLKNIRKSHPRVDVNYKPFAIGSKVRIRREKGIFEKGAKRNFKLEIFTINRHKRTAQGWIYWLEDYAGEAITSIFYHNELIPAIEPSLYQIEKIIRTRINPNTKKKEYFVKWRDYPSKFNQWVQDVEPTSRVFY